MRTRPRASASCRCGAWGKRARPFAESVVVCGCLVVWVGWCVGVWVCGCLGVWVCGCVGVWVCGCVDVWVCGCVGVEVGWRREEGG